MLTYLDQALHLFPCGFWKFLSLASVKSAPVSDDANGDIRVGKTDSVRKMGEETEGKTDRQREGRELVGGVER